MILYFLNLVAELIQKFASYKSKNRKLVKQINEVAKEIKQKQKFLNDLTEKQQVEELNNMNMRIQNNIGDLGSNVHIFHVFQFCDFKEYFE